MNINSVWTRAGQIAGQNSHTAMQVFTELQDVLAQMDFFENVTSVYGITNMLTADSAKGAMTFTLNADAGEIEIKTDKKSTAVNVRDERHVPEAVSKILVAMKSVDPAFSDYFAQTVRKIEAARPAYALT